MCLLEAFLADFCKLTFVISLFSIVFCASATSFEISEFVCPVCSSGLWRRLA